MANDPSDSSGSANAPRTETPEHPGNETPTLVINTSLQEGTMVLRLAGSVDMTTLEAFRKALDHIAPGDTVAVDLRAVRFIDSSGLGVIMQLRQRLGAALEGCTFVIAQFGQVERALTLTQLDRRLRLLRLPVSASAEELGKILASGTET